MAKRLSLSRRSVIAGAITASLPTIIAAQGTPEASPHAEHGARLAPIDLGSGIEITDFRVIPDQDPAHFIIEIQSRRDDAVDTPAIGMIIPNAPIDTGYSWARPWDPVLQPGQSSFGIGLLPSVAFNPEDVEWLLCDGESLSTTSVDVISDWDWELDWEIEVIGTDDLRITSDISNVGEVPFAGGELRGIVRDSDGRICGGTPLTNMYNLGPGATVTRSIGMWRSLQSIVNPFPLCGTAQDMDIRLQVQPRRQGSPVSCPIVMPWNR